MSHRSTGVYRRPRRHSLGGQWKSLVKARTKAARER